MFAFSYQLYHQHTNVICAGTLNKMNFVTDTNTVLVTLKLINPMMPDRCANTDERCTNANERCPKMNEH